MLELEMYFPENFVNPKEKETYDKIKSRTLLVLDSIINETDNTRQIENIDTALFNAYIPKIFTGSKSVEITYDKQFEDMCLLISQKMNLNAKKMTVLQFYNAVDNIKRQAEIENKKSKRNIR